MFTKIFDFWRNLFDKLPHPFRWITTVLLGFLIVVFGLLLLPLPGPGTLIIFIGLTILGLEFEWARQIVKEGEQWMERLLSKVKAKIRYRK